MKLTKTILLITGAILGIYETWTFFSEDPEDAISHTFWDWCKSFLVLRFCAGFVIGHLFLERPDSARNNPYWRFIQGYPSVATLAGLAAGYTFWQRAEKYATTKPASG
jgi:hypothetical protein